MICLVFGLRKNIELHNFIDLLKIKYTKSFSYKEKDFLKFDNAYIYINSTIIEQLINTEINTENKYDDIEQILYLNIRPNYLDYINVIKTNPIKILENYNHSYILPNSNKNLIELLYQPYNQTKSIFALEFNLLKYFTNSVDINYELLKNYSYIINEYDILVDNNKQTFLIDIKNDNYTYGLVLCFAGDFDNFDYTFTYLRNKLKDKYTLKQTDLIQQQYANNCYLITNNELINLLLDTSKYSLDYYINYNIKEEYNLLIDNDVIFNKILIKIDRNYINEINIVNTCSESIIEHIKLQDFILPKCFDYEKLFKDLQSDSLKYETKYVIKNKLLKDKIVYFNYV